MSLDAIWDVPITSPPKPAPVRGDPSPHKRPRQSLFFSGSDSDDGRPPKRAAPAAAPAARPDVDALFEDLDKEDEDDDLMYKPLAPALNLQKLAKEAEARHAHARPTAASQSASGSKTAMGGTGRDKGPSEMGDEKGKPGDGEKKGRKVLPKLDEERLVGPEGFPLLIQEIKGFKIKGRGHEVRFHCMCTLTLIRVTFSTRISIGYCRCTSFGHTRCFQRRRSKTRSTVLRNCVTPSACR